MPAKPCRPVAVIASASGAHPKVLPDGRIGSRPPRSTGQREATEFWLMPTRPSRVNPGD